MKALVIGEKCVDVFVYGSSTRRSPEGDAPVFLSHYETRNMGMAMNTANNLKSIGKGVQVDTFCSNGDIEKIRYIDIDSNRLYLRVDNNDQVERINLQELSDISVYDAVIISDYSKGFLREKDILAISTANPMVFLDTKKRLGDWCKYIKFIKLNRYEYEANREYIQCNDWIADKLIVTLDKDGVRYKDTHIEAELVENPDVSGAGDTFLATFAYSYLQTTNTLKSLEFANRCATRVVKKRGVSVC